MNTLVEQTAPAKVAIDFETELRAALRTVFQNWGITQKEAAVLMNVGETSLSRFMAGNQKATQPIILAARTIFQISLDELIPVAS